MRSQRLLWVAAAACLLALAAALLASRGSAATANAPRLLYPTKHSAPLRLPIASSNTASTVSRTFVSTTGSDSNACSATAPCRSFATALSKTTAGGEVVALTSGGYGPVGIGMAVTIVGAPGIHAAITAANGDGIDVEASSTDTVVLRNLTLSGSGSAFDGIHYTGGAALQLENITVSGFSDAGVEDSDSNSQLYATNVDAYDNGFGVIVDPATGTATADLDGVRADANQADGIAGVSHAVMRVSNCIAASNGGDGVGAQVPTMVSGCQLSDNSGAGVIEGSSTTVQVGGSTITHNGLGLDNQDGTVQSFGDNVVATNTTNTSGTITTISKT